MWQIQNVPCGRQTKAHPFPFVQHEESSSLETTASLSWVIGRAVWQITFPAWLVWFEAISFSIALRSYLNGLYNNPLCPETTEQIISLCSNVWREKLVTITQRAGVFLFPSNPPLTRRSVPTAEKVVYKASIDFKTIWQRINKTGEEGGLSHELFDQSTCHSWN